jgi:hypothetical protein
LVQIEGSIARASTLEFLQLHCFINEPWRWFLVVCSTKVGCSPVVPEDCSAVVRATPSLLGVGHLLPAWFLLGVNITDGCVASTGKPEMKFKQRTIWDIADMICGNTENGKEVLFPYRSSSVITRFFRDCETDYVHDGSTRSSWVSSVLVSILEEPQQSGNVPPETFARVIRNLMDQGDAMEGDPGREKALTALNVALAREGFEAFYGDDKLCYIRHIATNTIAAPSPNPHRPFSATELKKRDELTKYLDRCAEDELIEEVLLPLFRQLGFHRITSSGHKDKALEYGKDVWMKYVLPTQHVLYFGLQVKKDKLDAAGDSKGTSRNIAEIHNQVLMMLGHEVFDPETSKRVLVDHAFIVAGGEITKAAKNWLGNKLDATKRSQIMFMDRDDILNLYIVTNLPLPAGAIPEPTLSDDVPF